MDPGKTHAPGEHLWLALIPAEHLWVALSAAGIGIWSWERDGERVRWSPTLERLYGLAPGTFEGTVDAFSERLHPADRAACAERFARALAGAVDYHNEYRVVWPGGEIRWLSTEARILRDPSGQPIAAAGLTRDVTAQRSAEEAIRLSEERYRSLVTATAQFVWSANAAGEWVENTESWRAFTGQSAAQAHLFGWLDAVHPEDRERVFQAWRDATRSKTLYEAEHRVQKHDGTYRDFLARAAPVMGDQGEAREWIGVMIDVTEQKHAKQERDRLHRELERRQRVLEAVLRQMPGGIVVVEPPMGKLLLANEDPSFAPCSRPAAGSVADCLRSRAFHPDGRPYAPNEYPLARSLMFGEMLEGVEVIFEQGDGTRLVKSVSASPIRDESGVIVAAVVTSIDVTEKVRLMRELAAERARLAAVLDAIPSGVLIGVPPVGNISYANRQAMLIKRQPLPGQSEDRGYVRNPLRQLDGTPLEAHERPLARAVMRGESLQGEELIYERDDQTIGYCRLNSAPVFDEAGRIIAGVAAFEDISYEVEAKKAREQTEHFRELFVGMLGHDLRAPLSAIITGSSLLLRRASLSPEDARTMDCVVRASLRMTRMIDQILDLTRSRLGGGIPVSPRPMDLRGVIQQIVEEQTTANPGRDVSVDLRGDLQGTWDPDRLAQVLTNLMSNACEHADREAAVKLTAERAGPSVRLLVHNGGTPIQASLIPSIFDPFRRSSPKRPGAHQGLGLGLYICQQIAVAHGGTLEVASTREAGTTFTLALPVDESARKAPPLPPR